MYMKMCENVYVSVCLCLFVVCCVLLRVVETGNVRRNPGGVALLTCKSFEKLGERGRISQLVPSNVSLRITGTQQLHQVKRMIGGIGNMLFSTCSQTLNGKGPRVSLVNL